MHSYRRRLSLRYRAMRRLFSRFLRRKQKLSKGATSGAWQKYSYSWKHGIIWAECAKTLTKENPYDYYHFADCTCIPYRHAHGQTTCLRGADRTPSDQSPASGAACQAPVGHGCWSQQQPDCTPDAPQPWDRVRVAPSLARPDP